MDLTEIIERTKRDMAAITGLPPDTVSRLDPGESGWTIGIDMIEHKSIPRTQDLIASFEVLLDREGRIQRWRRTGRFHRAQGGEG